MIIEANANIFDCYIEINKPSIEECLDKVREIYKKVLIFPLLLFEGRQALPKSVTSAAGRLSTLRRTDSVVEKTHRQLIDCIRSKDTDP